MSLIVVLFAVFVCIGLFSRNFNKKTSLLVFLVAVGIAVYITLG